ncbi:spore coat protein [Rossellomorea aquimaris]|uniref:Spore coat protein n=1 Tax=Rossellomorea aquimaris TaxID=189382 RepID=A0A5D4TX69_9BACI|nr:spore coat protein [Rossellomorea aquimaris]TYS79414.1 spore coat protein [Rossellomorea aquimaris]
MSDSSKKQPKAIPSTVVDLLVSDIFRKNGVKEDEVKGKLSDEQKKWIKEMVQELSGQVDSFVNSNEKDKKE